MSISLQKGQKISLSKDSPGLEEVIVGLGWDVSRSKKVGRIDCDATVLLLQNGKLVSKDDTVYFGHLTHKSGSVQHMGDNTTGQGEGDDEQILINLNKVPQEYNRIVVVVNIYHAKMKRQHFGVVDNAFIRIVNRKGMAELCRYDLSGKEYDGMTAMIFGEVYRRNGEWKFSAIGEGTVDGSISALEKRYK